MKSIGQIIKEEVRSIISEIIDDTDERTIDMFSSYPSTKGRERQEIERESNKEDRVSNAERMADEISNVDGVTEAYVDDFNQYGSFQIVVSLNLDDRNMPKDPSFNIRKIRNAIDRIGKSIFGRYPSVEMPQMKYYPQYRPVRGLQQLNRNLHISEQI